MLAVIRTAAHVLTLVFTNSYGVLSSVSGHGLTYESWTCYEASVVLLLQDVLHTTLWYR